MDQNKIPRKYWYDKNWLGIDPHILQPTYFHILDVNPGTVMAMVSDSIGEEVYGRLHLRARDPVYVDLANSILNIICRAGKVVSDTKLHGDYIKQLISGYREDVESLLCQWDTEDPDDLVSNTEIYKALINNRTYFSLTRAQAEAVISEIRAKLRAIIKEESTLKRKLDPAAPTYFDLLEVHELIEPWQFSLFDKNCNRLCAELDSKARATNSVYLKQKYTANAQEIRRAAEILRSSEKREQYKKEILELRLASFDTVFKRIIKPGTKEITKKLKDELLPACERIGLSVWDLDQFLDNKGLIHPRPFLDWVSPPPLPEWTDGEFTSEEVIEILSNGAVGIDLGTTYSAVAAINEAGSVEVLLNFEGTLTTPSIVLFDEDGSTIVGEMARNLGQGQARNVVERVNRFMVNPEIKYNILDKEYSPEVISAIILKKLIRDASERIGRFVKSAVIATPAWFNSEARAATCRAGQIAGLNVLGLLSEPTAAAIAYSLHGLGIAGKTLLVYDLGGATFDVSIIRVDSDGTMSEITRDGDVVLGGQDWDAEIVRHVAEAFKNENGQKIPMDSNEYFTLGVEAEKAKKVLINIETARIYFLYEGKKIKFGFTRSEFESWTEHILLRTKDIVNNVLLNNSLTTDQIDLVLPVGGSTKMPQVRRLLDEMFPGKVDYRIEPDLAVAIGACWYMAKKILELKEKFNAFAP